MDAAKYLGEIVARSCLLLHYHGHEARAHRPRHEFDDEMDWLAGDARRWGLSPESVSTGVRSELRRLHVLPMADRLHAAFEQLASRPITPLRPCYWLTPTSCSVADWVI